jgi:hypothetical protein
MAFRLPVFGLAGRISHALIEGGGCKLTHASGQGAKTPESGGLTPYFSAKDSLTYRGNAYREAPP